jgi:hypothetical protein
LTWLSFLDPSLDHTAQHYQPSQSVTLTNKAANRTERERDEQQSYREGGRRGMSRPAEGAAGDGGAGLQKGRRFRLSPARCLPPDVLPPPSVFRSISLSLPLDSPSLPLDFPSLPLDSLFPSQVCANFIYFPPIPSQKSR